MTIDTSGPPFIRIPEIVPELCTSRILTMDLADGHRWARAVAAPAALRHRWGEVIFRFALGSLRRLGLVNADPHPGNYLFHDDGSVTFLDFGCVKRYTSDQVAVLEAAAQAVFDGDSTMLSQILVTAGFVDQADPPEAGRLLSWLREGLAPVVAPQPPPSHRPGRVRLRWLEHVHHGLAISYARYPFLAYGTDWLASGT